MDAPTIYDELTAAYAFFNGRLFGNRLPTVVIIPRVKSPKKSRGTFQPSRWQSADGMAHELAMNASLFPHRTVKESLSTLVHEMVHVRQQEEGKPSRNGYHNAEWGLMMEMVGLLPTDTGEPGGKRTGQNMTHYIILGGLFDRAADELLASGFTLSWYDRESVLAARPARPAGGGDADGDDADKPEPKSGKRLKYTCPGCDANAWGRAGLQLVCGTCSQTFQADGQGTSLQRRILEILQSRPGASQLPWMRIAELRQRLREFDDKAIREALVQGAEARLFHLTPIENPREIATADRDAALVLGQTACHLLSPGPAAPHH